MKEIDIRNAYIVNGHYSNNQWVTSIQSILETKSNTYFLSHECRMENVHYLDEKRSGIFVDLGTGQYISGNEWITLTVEDKFYAISTLNPGEIVTDWYKRKAMTVNNNTICPVQFSKQDWISKVYYTKKDVKQMSLEEVLNKAHKHQLNVNNYIAVIKYGMDKKIIMPLNYINYSSRENDYMYIQPIQGKVLLELNGHILNGYISYAMKNNDNAYCEFTPEVIEINNSSEILRSCYSKSIQIDDVHCRIYEMDIC